MEEIMKIDRISELPLEIQHIVLSFLPVADQFSASLLSNSWKSAWDSLIIRDFDECLFKRRVGKYYSSDLFTKFVDKCIRRIHTQNSLKDLRLMFEYEGENRYKLPSSSLVLNSLNFLSLSGCNIVESSLGHEVKFSYLKVLSLVDVNIKESTFHKMISCCPVIRILTLIRCYGIENLRIYALRSLVSVHIARISDYNKKSRIEINSPTLLSYYQDNAILDYVPDLMCINLLELSLNATRVAIDEKQLESLISKFPLLSTLVLHFIQGIRVIRISSPTLKTLKIRQHFNLREAHIHAPSLEALEISLWLQKKDHLKASISVDAAKLQKIELDIKYCGEICTYWFVKLRAFLKQFVQKMILSLEILSPEVKWNVGEISGTYALSRVAIEHLNLNISKNILCNFGEFLERLFWSCHPNSLSLRLLKSLTKNSLKTVCELIELVDNPIPDCCDSAQIKCWRHYLKSYQITQANNRKIIDCKDFLGRANRYDSDKVGSSENMSPQNTEFPDIAIDFVFLW